ncbi:MAG: hypothetical protein QM820_59395 [Minicystis sp.]
MRQRPGHWLEPLATVLNTVYHDPVILDALARGERGLIANQGMVFVHVEDDHIDAEARALWTARTGAELQGEVMLLSPAWIRRAGNYIPRDEVIALLETMVSVHRQSCFPWLFCSWPCALEPAPGEEALLRALEARAARWDDELLFEASALGLFWPGADPRALDAKRRALARWGLPRLGALLEAAAARAALASDRERWDEVQWSQRAMAPPVSLRYFLDEAGAPEGVSIGRWLGACEAVWQRIPVRPVETGAQGEWVARVLGRRVALRFSVELGTATLTGWRPAADDEPETPLLAEVDRDRETALWSESCQLFARWDALRETPTPVDERYLRWLADAWSTVASSLGTPHEPTLGPRRSLLLRELSSAGLFEPREAMRAYLTAQGHTGLLRVCDAAGDLLRYLKSPERRARTGYGFYGRVLGAWVSPLWFLQADPSIRGFDFTAQCEAALHEAHLGPAWAGQVRATIEGTARLVRWRRETGVVPALCGVSAPEEGVSG